MESAAEDSAVIDRSGAGGPAPALSGWGSPCYPPRSVESAAGE